MGETSGGGGSDRIGTGSIGHSESAGGLVVGVGGAAAAVSVFVVQACCRSSRFGVVALVVGVGGGRVSCGRGFLGAGCEKEKPGRSSGLSEKRPLSKERADACESKTQGGGLNR